MKCADCDGSGFLTRHIPAIEVRSRTMTYDAPPKVLRIDPARTEHPPCVACAATGEILEPLPACAHGPDGTAGEWVFDRSGRPCRSCEREMFQRERVEKLRAGLANIIGIIGDDESAHASEDKLYVGLLTDFATDLNLTANEMAALAKLALKARNLQFSRWYA